MLKRAHIIIALLSLSLVIAAFEYADVLRPHRFPELTFFPPMPVSQTNPVTVEGAMLGRYLFYDPILSADSTVSCGSCHKQSAAFSDGPNVFSKGSNGKLQSRNTLPLFNLAWNTSFFWDGKVAELEEQVFHPIRAEHEMKLSLEVAVMRINRSRFYKQQFQQVFGVKFIDSTHIAKAIAQFERTLLSYRSRYDSVLAGTAHFTRDEYMGFELVNDMTKGDCLHCHTTDADALGTNFAFSNTGLDKISKAEDYKDKGRGGITGNVSDNGKFKIPSLRNWVYTAPYMHDGRFKTIEEVLDFYSDGLNNAVNVDSKMEFAHQGGAHLSADEKRKILLFLKTMNDGAFITDTAFGDPFVKRN